jgi:hypothetical protein
MYEFSWIKISHKYGMEFTIGSVVKFDNFSFD